MSTRFRLLTEAQSATARLACVVAGAIFIFAAWVAPERSEAGLLVANFYFTSLAAAALIFLCVQNLTSAGWPVMFRRVPESMTAYLPVGAAATFLVALGARFIYPWAAAGGAEGLGAKAAYLNLPMFGLRAAVIWGVWLYFSRRLVAPARTTAATAAACLVTFAPTFTLASVDWLMSLEPRWTSTLYPWYVFAGAFQGGLAALAVLIVLLRRRGALAELNEHHLHDLGKYIFAFSCFWAYLWYCQYLLIWYSNIPDETTHFVLRMSHSWLPLFVLNAVLNFAAPFAILLPAKRKKREKTLLLGAGVVLIGRALDYFLLVMPAVTGARPSLGMGELSAFVLLGCLFVLFFDRAFASTQDEPVGDPYLEESRHFSGI